MRSSSCSGAADEASLGFENKHPVASPGINHYVVGTAIGRSDVERTLNRLPRSPGALDGQVRSDCLE